MKNLRRNLSKPVRVFINFILGLILTFVIPYAIAFTWVYLESFIFMEPATDTAIIKSITDYNMYPRLLTLIGIVVGLFAAFADHNDRYKTGPAY